MSDSRREIYQFQNTTNASSPEYLGSSDHCDATVAFSPSHQRSCTNPTWHPHPSYLSRHPDSKGQQLKGGAPESVNRPSHQISWRTVRTNKPWDHHHRRRHRPRPPPPTPSKRGPSYPGHLDADNKHHHGIITASSPHPTASHINAVTSIPSQPSITPSPSDLFNHV
jgi:hypothetical protein